MKLILQYSFSLNFQNGSLDCECKAKGPKRRSPRDLNRHVDDVDTLIDEIFNGDKWIYSYKYSCNSKNTWINISNQFTENEVTFFCEWSLFIEFKRFSDPNKSGSTCHLGMTHKRKTE